MVKNVKKPVRTQAQERKTPEWLIQRRERRVSTLCPFVLGEAEGLLLDVGCGTGVYLQHFQKIGYFCVGLDNNRDEILHGVKLGRANLILGDARMLPFKKRAFDTVFCSAFMEHLEPADIQQAIGEMVRVSRKKVVISTVNWIGTHRRGKLTLSDLPRFLQSLASRTPLKAPYELTIPRSNDDAEAIKQRYGDCFLRSYINVFHVERALRKHGVTTRTYLSSYPKGGFWRTLARLSAYRFSTPFIYVEGLIAEDRRHTNHQGRLKTEVLN